MKTDPICGMDVDEATALSATRAGVTAWFCCAGCRSAWLSGKEHAHGKRVVPPPTAKYFCPMCEGVVSDVPGTCPKCGMALEATDAGAEDDGELRDMTRRFWIGAVLTLPVFVLAMAHGQSWAMGSGWMQLALSTPVVFWAGWPFLVRGARSLRSRHLNMFTLISLGVAAAWIFSTASLVLRGPHADVYFEAAAMITVLAGSLFLRVWCGCNFGKPWEPPASREDGSREQGEEKKRAHKVEYPSRAGRLASARWLGGDSIQRRVVS